MTTLVTKRLYFDIRLCRASLVRPDLGVRFVLAEGELGVTQGDAVKRMGEVFGVATGVSFVLAEGELSGLEPGEGWALGCARVGLG